MKNPRPAGWQSGWLDWRRGRFWAWVIFVVYTLCGFVLLPWYARGAIVDAVHDTLGLEARLADVDVNPFVLSARLEDFAIVDKGGRDLVSFKDFYANFQLSSLFRRAFTFAELSIVEPFANFERGADGAVNLNALVPPPAEGDGSGETAAVESKPLRLIVEWLAIAKGRMAVADRSPREPYETQLGPIDVTVLDLNTLPDQEGQQQITVVGEGGAQLVWSGSLAVNPLRSAGKAQLTGLPLKRLTAYVPADVAVRVATGELDFAFDYNIHGGKSVAAKVDAFELELRDLRVDSSDAEGTSTPLLELPGLAVTGGRFAWPQRTVTVERLTLDRPVVALARAADGRFTWETIITQAPAAETTAPTEPVPAEEAAWTATVERFDLTGGNVRFTDSTLEPAAAFSIDTLDVGADRLTLADAARMPFTVKVAVDGGGTIALSGDAQVRPAPALKMHIDVAGLALATAQPYVAGTTVLSVDSGALDLTGDLAVEPDQPIVFKGNTAVAGFSLKRADSGDRIAEWKQLTVEGIDADVDARRVDLAHVVLDGAYGRVRIDETGTINVSRLLKAPPETAPEGPEAAHEDAQAEQAVAAAEPWTIRMRRFDMKNGSSDYRDDSLPIPFVAKISSFDGRMTGLDTSSARAADISFEGKVGDYGLVRVQGALQPLDIEDNALFTAKFENVELRDASPYSIRFAGRKIAQGKLDLDTRYELKQRKLAATHDIVLRDFKLGEKVDHPDAFHLPFDLAISLLKDSDGTIHVELPIEGDVDDPEFRIGGIIRQAIFNLITKIITAPFRLLGMLVGIGDGVDLDRVTFPAGRADLSPPEQEKIKKLAEALKLRPQLQLAVPAVSAPEADTAALQRARVTARIDEATEGMDPSQVRQAIETVAADLVTPEERAAIELRHTTAKTDRTDASFDEAAYLGELTDRLVALEPVSPDDLAALATARRDAVVTAIRAEPDVAPDRVKAADAVEVKLEMDTVPLTFGVEVLEVDADAAPPVETPAETPAATSP